MLKETREISEISELPEIREVVTMPTVDMPTAAPGAAVQPAPAVESPEKAPVEEPVARADADLEPSVAPTNPPATSRDPKQDQDQAEPSKDGGFFKWLFGKFGK